MADYTELAFDFNVQATDDAGQSTEQLGVLRVWNSVMAPAGMIASWPGEGDAKDIVGNHHGVVSGETSFTPAKVGKGFTFKSNDDRLSIPHDPSFDMDAGGFTAEFWMRGSKDQPSGLIRSS